VLHLNPDSSPSAIVLPPPPMRLALVDHHRLPRLRPGRAVWSGRAAVSLAAAVCNSSRATPSLRFRRKNRGRKPSPGSKQPCLLTSRRDDHIPHILTKPATSMIIQTPASLRSDGVADFTGMGGRFHRNTQRGKAMAGKSTLNRLELRTDDPKLDAAYKKISANHEAIDRYFVNVFLQGHEEAPERIILDLDATDDRIHGNQEGRFFHGYYGDYCYLPLYIFCGDSLLCARLRKSDIDQSAGSVDELKRIVGQIRERWPKVQIVLRADSGFCRDEIMTWCEANSVDYVFGLAKNKRLLALIEKPMEQAQLQYEITGKASRVFTDFYYRTLDTWNRARRVVAKAEHLEKGSNPRFIVTSLGWWDADARPLYEQTYCARGEMENRIKEQQLELFADRTSTSRMKSNQLRLWFSSVAYVVMNEMRRLALPGTKMEQAQCGTIRLKLLKIGAQVVVSVRRIVARLSSSYPYQELFERVYRVLTALPPLRC
jgi:Transposase DDE domain group 1